MNLRTGRPQSEQGGARVGAGGSTEAEAAGARGTRREGTRDEGKRKQRGRERCSDWRPRKGQGPGAQSAAASGAAVLVLESLLVRDSASAGLLVKNS